VVNGFGIRVSSFEFRISPFWFEVRVWGSKFRGNTGQGFGHRVSIQAVGYRGTSLIRHRPPPRTSIGPTVRSYGGAVSYEPGTPVDTLRLRMVREYGPLCGPYTLTPKEACSGLLRTTLRSSDRCRPNSAQIRQSTPDSGPGLSHFQTKSLGYLEVADGD